MRRKLNSQNRGFTLLEILLALFIFTIVSTIIVSALHTVFTAQSSTEKKSTHFAELQMAMTILSRDFEQVINRPISTPNNSIENTFLGTEKTATFTHAGYANPGATAQRSTLQRVRYRLENNTLIRDFWAELDQTSQTPQQSRALLHDVQSLTFEFLDQNGHFQERWPPASDQANMGAIPFAVRILLTTSSLGKLSQLYITPGQANSEKPK